MQGGARSCRGCACGWAELQLHVQGKASGGETGAWSAWELCASLQRIQVGWSRRAAVQSFHRGLCGCKRLFEHTSGKGSQRRPRAAVCRAPRERLCSGAVRFVMWFCWDGRPGGLSQGQLKAQGPSTPRRAQPERLCQAQPRIPSQCFLFRVFLRTPLLLSAVRLASGPRDRTAALPHLLRSIGRRGSGSLGNLWMPSNKC